MSACSNTWTQTGVTSLADGSGDGTITFPVTFYNAPYAVSATIIKPDGNASNITVYPYSVVQTGFSYSLSSGTIPGAGYTMSWSATAQQPAPQCSTGNNSGCGCGNAGCNGGCGSGAAGFPFVCPPGNVQTFLFQGNAGQPGPIPIMRGAYSPTAVYYFNSNRVDLVTYAGALFRTNNPDKNGADGWATPNVNGGDWLYIGPLSSFPTTGSNSYNATPNIGDDSTITSESSNHTEALTLTGAAGTRNFAVVTTGRNEGDRVSLVFTLPATPDIIIYVRNNTVGGAQLLPAEIYPANAYTTDGTVLSLTVELYFDGTAWQYESSKSPA